ncbi:glycine cleavage system aminomethyltransferase GcvT [Ornithinimicrobium cerasi]|uniref:Aminomethyltransferase n=1 Tax=Ornithinimicrobium cerasi TaxID=2248773 RepID=A0A285VF67_9MICO|nr:glycine cleavage system aminomethyltransferase GcvT [Ornithinimicrobium cerasi]SOC51756.1 aminomethyltransferase [Ornithinimicrobium cerasi]
MSEHTTKTSPLHEKHTALGAKMADFSGWSMPIEYPGGGVVAEHTAVRERVGLFDVSHLGNAQVSGAGAKDFLNACFTNDLDRIEPGKAQYTMCCDEDGGVVDDLIAYLRAADDVLLIPNAANTAEVVRRLREAAPEGVTVENVHEDYAILALQGPRSDEVMEGLGLPHGHDYMSFVEAEWEGHPLTVCRTGYTGERGYELVSKVEDAPALWDAIVDAMEPHGGMPCGLGARDTLRTEMGYALHGNELSPEITPVMARTGWAVGWKKEAFWGRDALLAQREAKESRLSGGLLVTGRGIPRAHQKVLDADGTEIGEITSGTFSPTLKQGIALALLDRGVEEGTSVVVDVRGRQVEAQVKKPPFVEGGASS